jgi:hypothetical protein
VTDAVTVTCTRCGEIAAEFLFKDGAGLRRKGFMAEVTKFGEAHELHRIFEMIHTADFARARGADADFVAFHCRNCNRSYCERCWRIGPPQFDDGFYDCMSGTCPEGHEQTVDD